MNATKKMYVVLYCAAAYASERTVANCLVKIPGLEAFKLGEAKVHVHHVLGMNCLVWELERVVSVPADFVVIFDSLGDSSTPEFIDLFRTHTQYWQPKVGMAHDVIYHVPEPTMYAMTVQTLAPIDDLFAQLRREDQPRVEPLQDLHITCEDDGYKANGQFVRFQLAGEHYTVTAAHNYPLVATFTLPDGMRVQLETQHGEPTAIQHIVTPSAGREAGHFAEWGNPQLLNEVTIPADHPIRPCFVLSDEPYL